MYILNNMKKQASSLQIRKSPALPSTYVPDNAKNTFKALRGGKPATGNATGKRKIDASKLVFTLMPQDKSDSTKPGFITSKNDTVVAHKTGSGSGISSKVHERKIFDLNASMTWFIDENDCLTHADGAFLHFLNIEKKDLNKKLADVVPEAMKDKFLKAHLSVRASGIPSKKILMHPLADGTNSQFFINIYPFTNHYNKNFLVGEAFDITGDLPIQEKIIKDDERFNVLKTTTETFWESDIASAYVYGSKKLHKLIGSGHNKAVSSKEWYKLVHPKDRKRVKTIHQNAAINNQSNWEQEFRLKTSGGYITLHEKGFIIYEKGQAVRMIGSLRDITELKVLESKLIKEKAKQRKKIIRAKVVAQEKERVYLGNELHDNVNQLLVASKLFLEIIKTGDAKSAEMKDNVGQYLATACNEIRNLSHGLVVSNFDQKGLAGSFKKILDDLALSGTFEIAFEHDEKIETLSKSKKITLLRILQEQTKNIIKHSRATKIDIGLNVVNNKVHLYIRDNGIGFDPRTLRRGIGLSNIFDRVKLYNGNTELNTATGMGCELKITIPVKGK